MVPTLSGLPLRPLLESDADGVVALVGGVYAEYPGCVLDLPGVDADLPILACRLEGTGGRGWVVTDDEAVVACVGLAPTTLNGRPGAELKRLYVAASHRRRGLGRSLIELAEHHGRRDHRAEAVELWSDTRFTDAHRLYIRCGYVQQDESRDLHDPSNTTEYRFVHSLVAH